MKPTAESTSLTSATFEDLVREMIVRLGEDPQREGLTNTPERVCKAMKFLTKGYSEDPEALLKAALFTVNYDEMVIVKDVEVFSLCEHHMLPFFGKVHVAYVPNGKVIGLSKIPRLIELFGWKAGEGIGERPSQDWNARVHPEDFASYRAALRAALKGATARLHCEYRIRLSHGEYRWVEDHALPVRDERGWSNLCRIITLAHAHTRVGSDSQRRQLGDPDPIRKMREQLAC